MACASLATKQLTCSAWLSSLALPKLLACFWLPLAPAPTPTISPTARTAGVVGIALALAGADVVLADVPCITPLTSLNVQVSGGSQSVLGSITSACAVARATGSGEARALAPLTVHSCKDRQSSLRDMHGVS